MKPSSKTYVKVILNLGIAALIAVILVLILPKVLVFFMPFLIGWVIALIASPLVRFLENRLKIKRKASTAMVIIAVIALVVTAGYLVGSKIVQEMTGLIQELPDMWDSVEKDFQDVGDNMNVFYQRLPENIKTAISNIGSQMDVFVGDLVGEMGTPTFQAVRNFAKNLPSFIIGVIMCLLSSYFFVAEKDYISVNVKKYMPEFLRYRWTMMVRSFKRAVGGYFKAQFKIEICMYLLLVVGFWILKVDYSLLIAFLMAILDFLPFFGTGIVLIPWAIVKILGSDYQMAVGLLILWCVGQLARQIIQPKIVGDSIGVPAIPTLFLLFIGYKTAGVFGMIVAVPIGIIVANMYEEGVFDTTRDSIKILFAKINNFRRLEESDMHCVKEYEEYQMEKKKHQEEKNNSGEKKI